MHRGPVGPKRGPDSGPQRNKTASNVNTANPNDTGELDRKGYPKEAPYQRVKDGGAVGDPSMQMGESWTQAGAGVDETVYEVGATPNERIMKDEASENLR